MTRTTAICALLSMLLIAPDVVGQETKANQPDPAAPGAPTLTQPLEPLSPNTLGERVDPAAGLPLGPMLPAGLAQSGRYVASGNVIITWSKEFDVAWGFSKAVGKWVRQEMNPPASGPPSDAPIITNDIAVWKVGSTLYAFSGAVARWDVLKLPEDHKSAAGSRFPIVDDNLAVGHVGSSYYGYSGVIGRWDVLNLPEGHTPPLVLDSGFARIHDGDDVYIFAASTGRWSSPQGKESILGIETTPADASDLIKVFTLRNARAADVARIVSDLYSREGVSVAVDERTNSVIVRAPAGHNDIVMALATRLDEQLEPTSKPATAGPVNSASVASQRAAYEAAEQRAASIAQQLRAASALQPAERTRLQAELRRAVADSFAARQRLHEAELAQLASRTRGIEQTIQARQKIADQIIDRRVEDLLNPNLQWESSPLASSPLAPREEAQSTRSGGHVTRSVTATPRITYGAWFPAEDEQIWTALGIKVRQLTADDSSDPKLRRFGLIISDVADSPDQRLRVGDIIIALQVTSGSPGLRKATLEIRRGDETFPVTVEFPSTPSRATSASSAQTQPPPVTNSTPASVASPTPADLTSARAYRDKLRQRWDALETLYNGGRVRLEEMLQDAIELGTAESAAAATTDERRKALQEHVERVKRIKKVVEDKYNANVEPIQNFLAAEAALIKAEAQLAAMGQLSNEVKPNPAGGSLSISLPAASSGQSLILRTPDEFRESLKGLENVVAHGKETIETRRHNGKELSDDTLQSLQQLLDQNQRDLAFLREQYAAQLRLLELELQDAESAVNAASKDLEQQKALLERKVAPPAVVREAQRAHEAARLRLEKAKTLLDLYRKADPKPAAAEPPSAVEPKDAT